MKLEYAWDRGPVGSRPVARRTDSDALSPLTCLLMDDGGVDVHDSLAWLREGLARVEICLAGTRGDHVDWDRESWGAAIARDETRVYSLLDDRCSETVSTRGLREALEDWIRFIEAGSGSGPVLVDLS